MNGRRAKIIRIHLRPFVPFAIFLFTPIFL